jgi:quercetin dioxygenase-like cupin family protein
MKLARSAARERRGDVSARFTGSVQIAAPFGKDGGHQGARLAFRPGARTAWHAHPIGQTLLVIEGAGRVQRDGGDVEPMLPGDIIWLEPGQKQWHGASPDQPVTLITIARSEPEADVVWMEHVTEEEYRGAHGMIEASSD